uniref:Uncharacterized protein n=1 Tax=Setaria viridis TaxID=4556 RepID=A0A4U6W4A3_SETVI|nr:hypothetical protein SEVIR_1G011600v2 [Setaria viridis]
MALDPYLKKVRQFFSCLLFSHAIDPSLSMMIVAFWMFVHENGGVDFFECMSAFNKHHILVMIAFVRNYVDVLVHLESIIEGIYFYHNNVCYEAVGVILNNFEIHESTYEYTQDHDERLKEEIYTRLGLVTNLAESSSQAHNTQDQGTSAHILETINETDPNSYFREFKPTHLGDSPRKTITCESLSQIVHIHTNTKIKRETEYKYHR